MPILWSNNFSPQHIPKNSGGLCPPTGIYKDVHSAIHIHWKLETIQCGGTVGRINCDLSTLRDTKYKYELLCATSWMIYTDIMMLQEHMQKSIFCMTPFIKLAKLTSADTGGTVDYLGRRGQWLLTGWKHERAFQGAGNILYNLIWSYTGVCIDKNSQRLRFFLKDFHTLLYTITLKKLY